MDPLQPPLISKYEWEYKNDINQRMRVPDKLSVATSLPNLELSEHHDNGSDVHENGTFVKLMFVLFIILVASSPQQRETSSGYSPDLLTDNEVQPDA